MYLYASIEKFSDDKCSVFSADRDNAILSTLKRDLLARMCFFIEP